MCVSLVPGCNVVYIASINDKNDRGYALAGFCLAGEQPTITGNKAGDAK